MAAISTTSAYKNMLSGRARQWRGRLQEQLPVNGNGRKDQVLGRAQETLGVVQRDGAQLANAAADTLQSLTGKLGRVTALLAAIPWTRPYVRLATIVLSVLFFFFRWRRRAAKAAVA